MYAPNSSGLDGLRRALARIALVAVAAAAASACSSGSAGSGVAIGSGQSTNDAVSPDFAVAYIRRPLRDLSDDDVDPPEDDPRVQRVWNGPADVFLRERAAPSALERNVTERVTRGQWDVRDLEPSYDGKKLLFSMRPPVDEDDDPSEQPKWSIYEYDVERDVLRRVIASDIAADEGHDVGPTYLPDGRILFSSSRQRGAKAILIDEGKSQYSAGIEGDRDLPAFTLHVMNADGTGIRQVSYNRNHDLDPVLLTSGEVLFTRWDNYASNDRGMHLYTMFPDGSGLQLLYGRNSHRTGTGGSVVQFLQPRPRPDGRIVALARPYEDTEFGGDLVLIDTRNYVENTQPSGANPGGRGPAQTRVVVNDVRTIPGPSPGGRYSSAFPLWDGTDRLLVSWTQCRVLEQQRIVPCTAQSLAQPNVQTAPPLYGVFIYDPRNNTQLPIVAPQEGVTFTEIVALQPRTPQPGAIPDAVAGVDYAAQLATEGVGILNIKSVYDVAGVDAAPGGIPTLRNPTLRTADQRPARFVRLEKGVGLPDEEVLEDLDDYAFGAAGQGIGMREILGYAEVEPDGSVRVKVPANVPFDVTVLDRNGHRIGGRRGNWLQVRTGEVLTLNGVVLEQPGQNGGPGLTLDRSGLFPAVNPGAPVAGQHFPGTALLIPDTSGQLIATAVRPEQGETMAEYRARAQLNCTARPCALSPSMNVRFADVWSAANPGGPGNEPIVLNYAALATPIPTDCVDRWEARCRGTIHYVRHIAPVWARPRVEFEADGVTVRSDRTCVSCHSPTDAQNQRRVPAGQLDLTPEPSDQDQLVMTSFQELLFTDNAQTLNMGALIDLLVPGVDPVTGQPTQVPVVVQPSMSGGGATASTRFFSKFAPGGSHYDAAAARPWLDPAELRLLAEWLDLGGQYYNDPFAVPVQ